MAGWECSVGKELRPGLCRIQRLTTFRQTRRRESRCSSAGPDELELGFIDTSWRNDCPTR